MPCCQGLKAIIRQCCPVKDFHNRPGCCYETPQVYVLAVAVAIPIALKYWKTHLGDFVLPRDDN